MSRKGAASTTPLSTTLITPRVSTTNRRDESPGGEATKSGRSKLPTCVSWRPAAFGGVVAVDVGGGAGFGLPTTSVPFIPSAAWPATVHRYARRAALVRRTTSVCRSPGFRSRVLERPIAKSWKVAPRLTTSNRTLPVGTRCRERTKRKSSIVTRTTTGAALARRTSARAVAAPSANRQAASAARRSDCDQRVIIHRPAPTLQCAEAGRRPREGSVLRLGWRPWSASRHAAPCGFARQSAVDPDARESLTLIGQTQG